LKEIMAQTLVLPPLSRNRRGRTVLVIYDEGRSGPLDALVRSGTCPQFALDLGGIGDRALQLERASEVFPRPDPDDEVIPPARIAVRPPHGAGDQIAVARAVE